MKAWYFATKDRKLRHGDGREVVEGVTHTHDGPLEMCRHGLHASRNIMDALNYAPGLVICRVRLGGKIIKGGDKCVASERTYLHVVDGERILHEFAIWCDERALGRAGVTDARCWNALRVKRRWLDGDATDGELAAARDAARDAARAAVWGAERKAQSRKLVRMVNRAIKEADRG